MKSFGKMIVPVLSTLLIFSSCGHQQVNSSKETLVVEDSKELKKTNITSHLEKDIEKGKNIIFCSTFQLAWNGLSDNIVKEKVRLKNEPEIVAALNKRITGKNDLTEKDYLAMSGYKRDNIINKINSELKRKFGNEAPKLKDELRGEDDIISYAFLYKNLQFEKEFENLEETLLFNGEGVKAFGIRKHSEKTKDMANQVEILDYRGKDDFVIKLNSKSNDDIILAKTAPSKNLLETISAIDKRENTSKTPTMRDGEHLIIPKFDFDITHRYSEIIGKTFLNKGFEEYMISEAFQNTKFKLSEKGAVLKSEAKIIANKSAQITTRSFIFDKPFLLILREKGAKNPYFLMWVDNTELMVK